MCWYVDVVCVFGRSCSETLENSCTNIWTWTHRRIVVNSVGERHRHHHNDRRMGVRASERVCECVERETCRIFIIIINKHVYVFKSSTLISTHTGNFEWLVRRALSPAYLHNLLYAMIDQMKYSRPNNRHDFRWLNHSMRMNKNIIFSLCRTAVPATNRQRCNMYYVHSVGAHFYSGRLDSFVSLCFAGSSDGQMDLCACGAFFSSLFSRYESCFINLNKNKLPPHRPYRLNAMWITNELGTFAYMCEHTIVCFFQINKFQVVNHYADFISGTEKDG